MWGHQAASHYLNQCWQISIVLITPTRPQCLRPRQNGRHFPDDLFKCFFLSENVWISIKISLKFVPKCPIDNILIYALVQIMAWRRLGDKPLSEPMIVWLPTHICITQPQWVNWNIFLVDGIFPLPWSQRHLGVITKVTYKGSGWLRKIHVKIHSS